MLIIRGLAGAWRLYTSHTSLHGIKYVKDSTIPPVGKFIWLAFFLGAVGISIYMAEQVYYKYSHSPIITSLKAIDYKLESEHFPAVTVCIVNADRKNFTSSATKTFQKWEANSTCVQEVLPEILWVMEKLWVQSLGNSLKKSQLYDLEQNAAIHCNMTLEDLHQFLTDTSVPKVGPSFLGINYTVSRNTITRDELRQVNSDVVLTNHGSCFSANYQRHNNSLLKIDRAGFNTGLRFIYCNNRPFLKTTNKRFQEGNFLVLLHDPYDFPDMFLDKPNVVSLGELASLSFQVTKVVAAPQLAKIPLTKRNCLLPSDKPQIDLLNLAESLGNCYSNCMARNMIKSCGCLPHFYTGLLKRGITYSICNFSSYICLTTVSYEVRSNLSMCDCYSNCNTVRYTPDVWFQTPSGSSSKVTNCSEISVFAKTTRGYNFEIDIRYGWEELMAAIGGILGLGVGFSFISLLEFIYFFCCHWWLEYFGARPKRVGHELPRDLLR